MWIDVYRIFWLSAVKWNISFGFWICALTMLQILLYSNSPSISNVDLSLLTSNGHSNEKSMIY